MKHFPLGFHKQAMPAGKASLAAGEQGKYWEMAEMILQNSRGLTPEKFEGFAKEIGLKVKQFKKDLEEKDAEYTKIIKGDMALGRKIGVRGTPTFFINGRKTRARNLDGYKQEIDKILQGQ